MNAFDTYMHGIIVRAQHECREDGSKVVEAQHLLLAIAAEQEPATHRILGSAGLDQATIRAALEREFDHSLSVVGVSRTAFQMPRPSLLPTHPPVGTSVKLVLERIMTSFRKKDLQPAHVLLAILFAEVGTVPRALALAGIDREDLMAQVRQTITTENT
ncbi:D-alanyl-D-alanine carboxypeptidase [Kibdelosporangium banguiense]|uniref:D-alanyl-D-alanine carboxypeptidase n=1 Tax=Kibdelosporangium banguiense TaxID=1365924 RepID=A0ABS4U0K4_9PSEU|nr:Clp protease N-terminal domain-containing protein [Kibdelosporangium banguiense]MBP2330181.1 D-alanyl-D-alanine carboxypeptidase [Kibdelosporangium banguiense]